MEKISMMTAALHACVDMHLPRWWYCTEADDFVPLEEMIEGYMRGEWWEYSLIDYINDACGKNGTLITLEELEKRIEQWREAIVRDWATPLSWTDAGEDLISHMEDWQVYYAEEFEQMTIKLEDCRKKMEENHEAVSGRYGYINLE